MHQNRNGSGCIESLIAESKGPIYDPNDNKCKKDNEKRAHISQLIFDNIKQDRCFAGII